MKTLLISLLFISNSAFTSNTKSIEPDKYLQESIALSRHFEELNESIHGIKFFTVGSDGACSYSTIQAAIDDFFQSPFPTIDIRIATNKTYFENIVLGDASISLTGGYSDCSVAAASGNPGNSQSLINASNNGTVLTIQGTSQRRTIEIKNIRMINGQSSNSGGGLLSIASDVALLLENVDIRNNSAENGAGIAIIGGNTDLIMNESRILGNVANYGGGIYCSGAASSVNVANHSGINANFANGSNSTFPNGGGGGAYIDGCYFAVFTGSPNNGSLTGMSTNSSVANGGAIFAENAIIRLHGHQSCGSQGCLGDDINPVSFRSNQSSMSDGSVIFAINSDVKANAVWIEGNSGNSTIYNTESDFIFERFSQPCWSNVNCNLIENNSGVPIYSSLINGFSVSNTTFKNNSDGVLEIHDFNSIRKTVYLESNVFFQNGSFPISSEIESVFEFYGPLDVFLIHNTIVDNNSSGSVIHIDWRGNPEDAPPYFEAHSNIIINPAADKIISHSYISGLFGGFTTIDANISALITDETDSISEDNGVFNDAANFAEGDFISQTQSLEVLFVDRANGDLHLSANSRAIDYFNTPSRATVTHKDMDFEERGFDDHKLQSPISSLFYYDIGADESYSSDVIFKNSFE